MRSDSIMQVVNSLIGVIAPILIVITLNNANAQPIQYLPQVPGYVPVYIRYGDQPLEEINPILAEAFHETTGISKSIGENRLDHSADENAKHLIDKNNVLLNYNKKDRTENSLSQVIPLKQLISAVSHDQKEYPGKAMPENESIVDKLSEFLPLENIEVKIIMDDAAKR